jgi:hypothetical protein
MMKGTVSDGAERRLRYLRLGVAPPPEPLVADSFLSGAGEHGVASWLATTFNHNFDAYDRAVDAAYNGTHVGGSAYHHLIDGSHSLWGALKAVHDVSADDGFAREFLQAAEHLLRDTASVAGVNPFHSLDPATFNQVADAVGTFGMSKAYLADALTINGPELLGGGIALAVSVVLARRPSPTALSAISGAYLLSAVAAANPFLLAVAAGGLAYALRSKGTRAECLVSGGKGAIASGSALLVAGLLGGPWWLGAIAGAATAICVRSALARPEDCARRVKELFAPAARTLQTITLATSPDILHG